MNVGSVILFSNIGEFEYIGCFVKNICNGYNQCQSG